MLTKIVLVMNIEVEDIYRIRNAINNPMTDEFVQYCAEDSIVFNKMIANLRNTYPKPLVDDFVSHNYNAVLDQLNDDELVKFFEVAFDKTNDLVYYRFEASTYSMYELSGKIVLPTAYDGLRPKDAVYIGWVTPHDIEHLIEHEGLTEHNANRVQNALSIILRKNKDDFDMFFDESPLEEVLEYIRNV
jgi:hypothetical protein